MKDAIEAEMLRLSSRHFWFCQRYNRLLRPALHMAKSERVGDGIVARHFHTHGAKLRLPKRVERYVLRGYTDSSLDQPLNGE